MILVLFQIVLTAAACFGLWRLWLSLAGRGRVSMIIGAGFLIRALAGQILFWISWLHLAIAPSLQLGNGFWFFAIDGPGYLSYADELIGRGVKATLFVTAAYPSRVYVQVFTAATAAFGVVASVAILFNCAAYLLTCAIITRIGSRQSNAELPLFVALAAIAFGPGTILWSLQPLKDTFFLLLVTAMIVTCLLWQELWRQGVSPKWRRLLAYAVAMIVLTYAIGGIRWYFAAIVWAACGVFFILSAIRARPRSAALLSGALLFVLLAQAVRLGGEGDIPPRVRRLLDPRPSIAVQWEPSYLSHFVRETREGFESSGGATSISAGPALVPPSPPAKLSPPAKPSPLTESLPPVKSLPSAGASPPVRLSPPAKPSPLTESLPPAKSSPSAGASPPAKLSPPAKPSPLTESSPSAESFAVKSSPPVPEKPSTPIPRRLGATLLTGFAAMFVPRFVAQAVGLVRIGGGRGFWLFVELDTLVLDAVVLFAVVYCMRALRSYARVTPLFVLLVLVFLMTAVPMMYTVSNFGTLFRLRQMIYLIVAILPLTLAPRTSTHVSS
jgi:hypothetical protein